MDVFDSFWRSLNQTADLLAGPGAGWLIVGVVLFELQQAVRTRGWFHIIRRAYPDARGVRARDVCAAHVAGAGLNTVVPARGGNALKLWLVHRRARETRYSTLAATFGPEALFDAIAGAILIGWALASGLLPLPVSIDWLQAFDSRALADHPVRAVLIAGALAALTVVLLSRLRVPVGELVERLRRGLAILGEPRAYLLHVVSWQGLARLIRCGSIAAYLQAFGLPVTPASVLLVMAVQGFSTLIPFAPASLGVRVALLAYGLGQLAGAPVEPSVIGGLIVGAGAAQAVGSLLVGLVALGLALGTASPRALIAAVRRRRPAPRHGPPAAPSRAETGA